MYHKARDMLRKPNFQRMVSAKPILKDGKRTQNIPRICSEPGWTEEQIRQYDALALEDLHLQKGDDGRRTGTLFLNKEGKQGPMRQRPDFREAKQAHRQQYKEHAESTGERINSIHPAHQARQNYRQHFKGSEEYNYTVHPRTGLKYYLSTSSSSSSQWQQHDDWKSSQSWDYL